MDLQYVACNVLSPINHAAHLWKFLLITLTFTPGILCLGYYYIGYTYGIFITAFLGLNTEDTDGTSQETDMMILDKGFKYLAY